MATPNDATRVAGLGGSHVPEPYNQTPIEDDVFEAGTNTAMALVSLAVANRLSTGQVDDVVMEYMNGFCSWLPMEAEIIRAVVDFLVPDRVENHDVSDFLDRNTDLTPQEVTILIAQIAGLTSADAIDIVLHHAGVPSREELLLLADHLEKLGENLFGQALSVQTQKTGGHDGEPVPMTGTVSTAREPAAVAEQTNAAPAPVDHHTSQIEMAESAAPPPGTAATRHAETVRQPGEIPRHW